MVGNLVISRIKPTEIIYGFAHKPDSGGDARLVTAVFNNIVISCCYAPYNNQLSPRMEVRKAWDNDVLEHCSHITRTHVEKSFAYGGDLNVLPRIEDVDRGAFSNLRQTLPPGATPGRSYDDLAAYAELLEKTGMINVKDFLNHEARLRTQWISPTHKAADIGQTCDHILATKNLINTTRRADEEMSLILQITFQNQAEDGRPQGPERPLSNRHRAQLDPSRTQQGHTSRVCSLRTSGPFRTNVLMAQITAQRPGAPETCIQFIGRPVIKVQVGAYYVYILLDSGSQFTIINPPEG